MTDDQLIALLAGLFLAADNVRGGLRAIENEVARSDYDWPYDGAAAAIEQARDLLQQVRLGSAARVP